MKKNEMPPRGRGALCLLSDRNSEDGPDDVNSIDSAEFLSGPTLANPTLPFRPNPRFGKARATLPGREIQLGLLWVF